MVFVHRTKRFRKCEKLIADCENCNPLIATRLPCFTDADCVIPAPFSRESRWFITAGAAWPGSRRLNMRSFVLAGLMAATAMPAVAYPDSPSRADRSEEHTSELQSLMRISYAVFSLKKQTHYFFIQVLSHPPTPNQHLTSILSQHTL